MKPFYTFVLVHLLFLTSICYSQTIWYVSPTGAGSQNGSSWANAATIETALNNAVTNTQIWVKQGNYAISSTLIPRPSNLSIYGGFLGSETLLNQRDWQNNITIFDGQGSVKIMRFQSDNGIIDGIHFRNGYITGVVSGPGATNDGGGALRLTGNNQIIRNCTFSNNISTAERGAGAIFIWHGEGQLIENCVFENNKHTIPTTTSSNGGGAIHNWDNNVTIRNCRFSNNSSTKSDGAIYTWGQNFKIENSSFQNNHSDNSGGAIHLNYYELNIKNSVFTGNSALRKGGAIYNSHIIKITNSLFNRNTTRETGGAIANQQELHVTNSTFVANNNTAISHRTFASDSFSTYLTTIYNSIFYNNTSTSSRLKDVDKDNDGNDQSTKDFRFNIFQENTAGTGNLVGINPLFVNNTNNFRLQPSSPAVNYGNNSLYNQVSGTTAATSTDLANLPRLFGASIDLGAYELQQEPISTPSCTILTFPANNATNVSIGTHFSWNPISNVAGYRLTIGTTSGGNDILNNMDVGNVTTYNLPTDLAYNTTYYVSIIPYNSAGNAQSCQEFSFTTEQEPCPTLLVNLEVSGNSVRIIVLNGNPPYAYNLDQQGWTTNNLFTHLSYGTHQIEVRTSNGCSTSLTFDILEVQNFISPNGDGKNDLLDFSFLSTKENPKLLIVDRFGKAVFKDHGESNFIWNGKHPSGSPLPSTTYWYRLEWKEANAENTTSLQGAILLKSK